MFGKNDRLAGQLHESGMSTIVDADRQDIADAHQRRPQPRPAIDPGQSLGVDKAQAFEAGNVWINTWGAVSSMAPYGGYKQSGYGREMGFAVMREVTQEKSVWVNVR